MRRISVGATAIATAAAHHRNRVGIPALTRKFNESDRDKNAHKTPFDSGRKAVRKLKRRNDPREREREREKHPSSRIERLRASARAHDVDQSQVNQKNMVVLMLLSSTRQALSTCVQRKRERYYCCSPARHAVRLHIPSVRSEKQDLLHPGQLLEIVEQHLITGRRCVSWARKTREQLQAARGWAWERGIASHEEG